MVNQELLKSILVSERQWKRHCRIDHARMRANTATSTEERNLWLAVLNANGGSLEAKTDKREKSGKVVKFARKKSKAAKVYVADKAALQAA